MPIPKIKKGEKKQAYLSRCISSEIRAGKPRKQAAAICYDQTRKNGKR